MYELPETGYLRLPQIVGAPKAEPPIPAVIPIDLEIIICADNDQWIEGNPGLGKAREVARAVGAKLAIPNFRDTSTKPTDFNDLHRGGGAAVCRGG